MQAAAREEPKEAGGSLVSRLSGANVVSAVWKPPTRTKTEAELEAERKSELKAR